MEAADLRGMLIYRASRVEALLDPLMTLMQAAPPQHALAPHELIAAHPGMQRWLGRELAIRQGPSGVAANLRIELPSAWLDRLAHEVLGREAVALRPYRRELLRWRINEQVEHIGDAQVQAYLAGDAVSRARRRFQLADRLARIYTQYLVYRPDWLQAWADGREADVPGGFLAPLWQVLRKDIGVAHRGELVRQLIAALADGKGAALAPEPLHVFGVAHLAPAELAVLRAVSEHRAVVLYVPDPCRAYWGGLRSDRAALREQVLRDPAGTATEGLFLEQGHPLLGAWGRMGQHFVLALEDCQAAIDLRSGHDEADADPADRLAGVQESIRRFDPGLIGEHAAEPRADASLRIHACHTRLRELEVLRDALLDARSARPDLKPADIVVMMPDIHAYLPLLPAVFGEAGRHEGPLPYHVADVAVARTHPLFEAFRRLLDLPQSRLTAPEVADLLAIEPIAARLGLRADDVEVLERWLADSRVAWALDGDFRARFDVPAIAEHTFAWAMDRMLAGYVLGAGDGDALAVTLPDGAAIAPLDGVHGPQAALLGALDRLLLELREACADGGTRRRASAWAERLEQRLDALFLVDPNDRDAREALAALRQFVRALASEPGESGLDPELDFSVVREILLARLDGVPERQRFLLGGVTFCGMVPQRAIPFEVVAVLGLNDGEFPRAGSDGGLDPMSRHRRLGDRDVRSDDRYLFLETMMAARWRLHLSWIGQGVRDGKPRNPAAPLAELMAALDAGVGIDRDAPNDESDDAKWLRLRPWWVRHPLQPFDARYFDGNDPALFSFRREFAQMREGSPDAAANRPFVDPARAPAPATQDAAPIALSEVLAYFRDPAKQLLANHLNLRLDALDEERLREVEPLEATFDALDTVAKRLFLQAVASHPHALPDAPPDWLRLTGLLPPGRIGEAAWASERGKAQELLDAVASPEHAAHALFAQPLPESQPVLLDRTISGRRICGELRDVYDTDAARWVLEVRPGKQETDLGFRERIALFLRWALLRLDTEPECAVRAALIVSPESKRREPDPWASAFNDWDDRLLLAKPAVRAKLLADLERRVAGLVEFFLTSQRQPQWYFPRTSWAAVGDDPAPAVAAWAGGYQQTGERDYGPGYARLLAGERDFGDAQDYDRLHAGAERLRALIRLDAAATEGTA
ncbi:MAG: exodeoxyribonuclease V subunit gamma [Rhodanobacteraceae bacterium]|jgi:exodeoxyribonuclease V gamma subunit|nr:exodeoxyribonuclease V subunit gamma [Rhodanobacteraceae bacterium]